MDIHPECYPSSPKKEFIHVKSYTYYPRSPPAWRPCPPGPNSSGWGYYPSGGVGLLLVIVLILALTRRK